MYTVTLSNSYTSSTQRFKRQSTVVMKARDTFRFWDNAAGNRTGNTIIIEDVYSRLTLHIECPDAEAADALDAALWPSEE